MLEAAFEGHAGRFLLDTGSNGGVTLNTPTVERLALLEGRSTRAVTTSGLGGTVSALQGSLSSFTLGGTTLNSVPALFSTAAGTTRSDPYVDGLIGSDVLARFTLVFDLPHDRVGFTAP